MNLHLAIPLSDKIKKNLQRLCFGLPSAEWNDEENFCILFYTFNNADGNMLLDLKESLQNFNFSPFPLKMKEVIPHQSPKKGQGTLRIELMQSSELENFILTLEKILKPLHLKEKTKHKPHILLGKYTALSPERLVRYLESTSLVQLPSLQAERLQILISQNTPKRTIHYIEGEFP